MMGRLLMMRRGSIGAVAFTLSALVGNQLNAQTVDPESTDPPQNQIEPAQTASDGTASTASTDPDPSQRLRLIYQATQTAESEEALTQVIIDCDAILAEQLPESNRKYAEQLLTWGLLQRADLQITQELTRRRSGPEAGDEPAAADREALATVAEDLERALKLDSQSWKGHMLQALTLELRGQRAEAIESFGQVVELNPQYNAAWFSRAELHSSNGDFVLAIHDYNKALGIDPRDPEAYTGRGHAYLQMGKFLEALADYQKLILLTEGEPRAHLFRGDARLALGLWERARDDYELGVARQPDSLAGQRRLAWLYATCPDPLISNPKLAVQLAEKAVAHEQKTPTWETSHLLATALAAAGRTDEAREILDRWADRLDEQQLKTLTASRDRWEQASDASEID